MRAEARRQFVHFLLGSFFIALVVLFGVQKTAIVLAVVFVSGLFASWLLKKGVKLPLLKGAVERVEREHEKHLPGKGALIFFLGAIVLTLLFQNPLVVIGALCVAAYGDAASTLFGMKLGKHCTVGKKTVEGTLGGILVSVLFLGMLFEWWIALIAAVAGMLAELLPFDDSFSIPIVAAIVLTVLL